MRVLASRIGVLLLLLMTRSKAKNTDSKDDGAIDSVLNKMKSCKDLRGYTFEKKRLYCSSKEILIRCPMECGRKEKIELLQSPKLNDCTWLKQNDEHSKWCASSWVQMKCKETCYRLATRFISQTQHDGKRKVKRKIARRRHAPKDAMRLLEGFSTTSLLSSTKAPSPSSSTKFPTSSKSPFSEEKSTKFPSSSPFSTKAPSNILTKTPTTMKTWNPSLPPTHPPSPDPSFSPSVLPSFSSDKPSISPTSIPSEAPSMSSESPSSDPSALPSILPSFSSDKPSISPTSIPSVSPSFSSDKPSISPTSIPTAVPTSPSSTNQPTKQKKPNILIILADDVGTSDIPYWGDNIVPMHSIQKLQSQGVTFMDAHASPLCAPSRYMLLSGNYPHRGHDKGGTWNLSSNRNQFVNNQKSIAEVLKDQFNYHTGMFGKWHLGGRVPSGGTYSKDKTRPLSCCNIDWKKPMEDGPNDIGFDESFYTTSGIQNPPYSFFRNGYLQTDVDDIKFWEKGSHATVNNNGESIIKGPGEGDPNWDSTEYNTKLVKEVDNFLENHDTSDPFFLYVGLGSVHVPHSPPKFYMDGTPVAETFGHPHLDMLYEMDLVISSMISSVEDRGLMDNTLVIFASDNGGLKNMNHTKSSDRHFRGGKGTVWEGGHRVPMIMRYDGVLDAGQKRTGLVGLNDIYATLADIVGFDIPDGSAQDSISFADHALTETVDSKREFFGVWLWKSTSYALRWGNFKYSVTYNEVTEENLYDLNTDVKEERNLLIEGLKNYEEIKMKMSAELRRLGPCPVDIEEPFLLTYGPDAGSRVTCDYFRRDKSRCKDQVLGEVNCNSVCGRFRGLCEYYDSCVDNPYFAFETENVGTRDCNWLAIKDVRIQRYCGDESIASECSLTCDRCTD